MDWPYRFPSESDKVHQEAIAYRRLNPTERFLAIVDLVASGTALLDQSPHREAGLRLREAQESEWRRIQKELFSTHAR